MTRRGLLGASMCSLGTMRYSGGYKKSSQERNFQTNTFSLQTCRCPYRVLNVSETATVAEIKKAYLMLAQKVHPDKAGPDVPDANTKFSELSGAYHLLADKFQRSQYDSGLIHSDGREREAEPVDDVMERMYNQMMWEQGGRAATKGQRTSERVRWYHLKERQEEREEYLTKIRDLLARDSEQEAVRKLRVVMLYYSNYFDPTALKVLTTRQDS